MCPEELQTQLSRRYRPKRIHANLENGEDVVDLVPRTFWFGLLVLDDALVADNAADHVELLRKPPRERVDHVLACLGMLAGKERICGTRGTRDESALMEAELAESLPEDRNHSLTARYKETRGAF